VLEKREKW
jgi:hypothetical protein